jgi:hypothetical protein
MGPPAAIRVGSISTGPVSSALCWSAMPRIGWVEDGDAEGALADLYAELRARRPAGDVPAILRTMSVRPDFLVAINRAANVLHFTDGALSRAQHEMIASYVSALNRCHY